MDITEDQNTTLEDWPRAKAEMERRWIILKLPRDCMMNWMQGYGSIRYMGMPDDMMIIRSWIDNATHDLCFIMYHPSFEPTQEGSQLRIIRPEYRFRTRIMKNFEGVFDIGFMPNEDGRKAKKEMKLREGWDADLR